MFWPIVIGLGIAWIAQSFLSFRQTQAFSKTFVAMRRQGRVAMGKFRGGIAAGSIVMFRLDEDDLVVEGKRLAGVTVVARFKTFDTFNGDHIGHLDVTKAQAFGKSVQKAVRNAVETYTIVQGGGEAPEPPTALGRVLDKLPGITPKQRVLKEPLADHRVQKPLATPAPDALVTPAGQETSKWKRKTTT